ncbi:hypothetical protein [Paradevosia shaoguanensis]|uniref:Uncharacterized protein n=1 Tax=Paradevosia shaoguanensis TaxID=1335043 RepID=A0AA41QRB3_9HYPH|nr:hypothetical protein [Paradevosia shaoguanensis]MCF1744660.1 hypothetical protein [Paradevosia shaoguanensis]MCI0129143.1 hypothetical protein [Paradevosia shaoguanensis]
MAAPLWLGLAFGVLAQSDKADCEILKGPLNSTAAQMSELLATLKTFDEAGMVARLEGNQRDTLAAARAARLELVPRLEAFVAALEDAGHSMAICLR